jgi:hypothetical protein
MPDEKKEIYTTDDAACSPEFGDDGCKIKPQEPISKEKPKN